jgi:hypothetical protein
MSAEFAQACEFYVCNAEWFTPVPGLGPELCHDFPRPWVRQMCDSGTGSILCYGIGTGKWQHSGDQKIAQFRAHRI